MHITIIYLTKSYTCLRKKVCHYHKILLKAVKLYSISFTLLSVQLVAKNIHVDSYREVIIVVLKLERIKVLIKSFVALK